MKRFLFLACGAALMIVAGSRLFFFLGVYVTAPASHAATAHIQFDKLTQQSIFATIPDTPPATLQASLSSNVLASVCRSQGLAEFFAKDLGDIKPSALEAMKLLTDRVRVEKDIAANELLLTCYSPDPQNARLVANALARACAGELETKFNNQQMPLVVREAEQTRVNRHLLKFLLSSELLTWFGLMILGAGLVLFGRCLPPTVIAAQQPTIVVQPKY